MIVPKTTFQRENQVIDIKFDFCVNFSRKRKLERIEGKFKTQNPNLIQINAQLEPILVAKCPLLHL